MHHMSCSMLAKNVFYTMSKLYYIAIKNKETLFIMANENVHQIYSSPIYTAGKCLSALILKSVSIDYRTAKLNTRQHTGFGTV